MLLLPLTCRQTRTAAMALSASRVGLALLLLCAAVPVEPSLTFEDVRRIALASSGSAAPAANQRLATADGLAKAKELGIPIDVAAIKEHPALAQVACKHPVAARHAMPRCCILLLPKPTTASVLGCTHTACYCKCKPDRMFVGTAEQLQLGSHLLQTPVAAPPDDTQEKYASAQLPDAPQQGDFRGTLIPLSGSMRDFLTPCLLCHGGRSAALVGRTTEAPADDGRSTEGQRPGGGHPVPAHRRECELCEHRRHAVRAERQTLLPRRHQLVQHCHASSCTCVPDMFTISEGRLESSSIEVAHRRCHFRCIVSGAPHAWHPALTPDCHAAGTMIAACVRVNG